MPINPQIVVPQVQGIQLENPLALARNAMAIQEARSTIAANQLKSNRAALTASIFKQNAGKSPEEVANALFAAGLPDEAENVMKYQAAGGQSAKSLRDAEVAGLQLLGSEAGAFLDNPASLNKSTIMPWAQNAVQRKLLTPDALARFEAMPDDPGQIATAMRRLQVQALTPAQQTETSIIQQDLGGSTRALRIPKLGGPGEVVPGTEATVTASPNRQSNTIVLPPLETAERKGKGELNVEAYKNIQTAANAARKLRPSLQTIRQKLDEGFKTGFFAPIKKEAAAFLTDIGVKDAEKYATDAQTFFATAQQRVLDKQLEQKGTQTTSDAQRMTQTFAQLGNTEQANRFLVDITEAQGNRDEKTQRFYDKWWNEKGTYEGAENAWLFGTPEELKGKVSPELAKMAGRGSQSLFDDPLMKKYAPTGASAGIVKVNSPEEARKLAPGTKYQTPSGKVFTRKRD
jgi:hypothetical protein